MEKGFLKQLLSTWPKKLEAPREGPTQVIIVGEDGPSSVLVLGGLGLTGEKQHFVVLNPNFDFGSNEVVSELIWSGVVHLPRW